MPLTPPNDAIAVFQALVLKHGGSSNELGTSRKVTVDEFVELPAVLAAVEMMQAADPVYAEFGGMTYRRLLSDHGLSRSDGPLVTLH